MPDEKFLESEKDVACYIYKRAPYLELGVTSDAPEGKLNATSVQTLNIAALNRRISRPVADAIESYAKAHGVKISFWEDTDLDVALSRETYFYRYVDGIWQAEYPAH